MDFFSYDTHGANTYLIYTIQPTDNLDTMSLGMLTNNKIPGLAPTLFTQVDNNKYIKYNVSSKVSASQFLSGAINKKRLIGVFQGITEAMLSAEEYMIDPRAIIVDLDYMFVDVSTSETVLICLPLAAEGETIDLRNFFKEIIFRVQFDPNENNEYVAKLISYLNSAPAFSAADFSELLKSLSEQAAPAAQVKTAPVSQPVVRPASSGLQPEVKQAVTTAAPQPVTQAAMPQPAQPVYPQPINNTPAARPAAPVNAGNQSAPVVGEKDISFSYLMAHYNKENAAKYKAQKEAKKSATSAGQQQEQFGQSSFAVPGQIPPAAGQQPSKKQPAAPSQPAPAEKEISFGYLMAHYNKENAAVYKAQKAARKAGAAPQSAVANNNQVNQFTVPGAPVKGQPSFAIPGQPAPAPVPVPAQPQINNYQQQAAQPQPQSFGTQQYSQPQGIYQQEQPQVQTTAMDYGETTTLNVGMIGETTVLNGQTQASLAPSPHLIRAKNNEKIPVNKPVFRIGKEKSYVDYFISDNTAVSRSHANIVTQDGHYFIVDTNSTNHTYVDGQMISSNTQYEIFDRARIRLANEEFEFRLY